VALTVSPAVKVFALIGVVLALVMAVAFFLMGGAQEPAAAAEPLPSLPSKKAGVVSTPATKPAKKPAAAAAKAVRPKAPAAKKVRAAKAPAVAKNGLPMSIARALAAHDVVVVSLYGEDWKIDPMARDEAAAGAQAAGAGFVGLDVTSANAAAEALILKYDTIFRAPAVLVFRRGGELAVQLDGFRDRATVAQAAANARP
jgi:hypothetical protein